MCDVLLKLGVDKIKHSTQLNNKINVSKSDNYSDYYDETLLNFVNEFFISDFEFLQHPIVNTVEELKKDSEKFYVPPEIFAKKNEILLNDLEKRGLIENSITINGMTINMEPERKIPADIFTMAFEKMILKHGGKILKKASFKFLKLFNFKNINSRK